MLLRLTFTDASSVYFILYHHPDSRSGYYVDMLLKLLETQGH